MSALRDQLAGVLDEHEWAWRMATPTRAELVCVCGDRLVHESSSAAPTLADHNRHLADALLPAIAAALDETHEATARAMALIEPGEDWPTNEALGGGLTGTRDDEYRDGMRDEAANVLAAQRATLGLGVA